MAIERLITAAGGSVESFYFVFGDDDVIVVVDMPDNATSAAVSLAVSVAGGATTAVRVLVTPEEIDAAAKKTIDYRATGADDSGVADDAPPGRDDASARPPDRKLPSVDRGRRSSLTVAWSLCNACEAEIVRQSTR